MTIYTYSHTIEMRKKGAVFMTKPIAVVDDSSLIQVVAQAQKALVKARKSILATRMIAQLVHTTKRQEVIDIVGYYVTIQYTNVPFFDMGFILPDEDDDQDGDIIH